MQLQLIDLLFDGPNDLQGSQLFLLDADTGGKLDILSASPDTEVLFGVLNPANALAFTQTPADFTRLDRWADAPTNASLKVGANQNAEAKPLLLKRLSLQDAKRTPDGRYQVRLMALALVGNDINRFDIQLSQPASAKNKPQISLPFYQNSLPEKGWVEWEMQAPPLTDGRASFFIEPADGAIQPWLNQLQSFQNGKWTSLRLAEMNNRLLAVLDLPTDSNQRFRLQKKQGGVRLRAAKNGQAVPILNLKWASDSEKTSLEDLENDRPTRPEVISPIASNREKSSENYQWVIKSYPVAENCQAFRLDIEAQNARIRQVEWQWLGQKITTKSASIQLPEGMKQAQVVAHVQLLVNNQLLSETKSLLVRANQPPIADGGINRNAAVGEYVAFDGTLSEDPDGRIKEYFWEMGDGQNKSGARIEHQYRSSGRYKVILTVIDNSGNACGVATDTLFVDINAPPVVEVRPKAGWQPGLSSFEAGQSFDPDGSITRIEWFLGNQKLGEGVRLEQQLPDSQEELRVVVTDNSDAANNQTEIRIPRTNESAQTSSTTADDEPIAQAPKAIELGMIPERIQGQSIVFRAQANEPNMRFEWSMGDGTTISGAVAEHAYKKAGSYTIRLKAYAQGSSTELLGTLEENIQIGASSVQSASANDTNTNSDSDEQTEQERGEFQNNSQNEQESQDALQEDFTSIPEAPVSTQGLAFSRVEGAAIEGPASVFVGEEFSLELKTEAPITTVFWDNGTGLLQGENTHFTRFSKAGRYQISAVYFIEHEGKKAQRFLTTEVQVIDRRQADTQLQQMRKANQRITASSTIQLLLNAGGAGTDIFSRPEPNFVPHPSTHTKQSAAQESETYWYGYDQPCADQRYNLLQYFALPEELIPLDKLFVFVDGIYVPTSQFQNKAVDMSKVRAWRIRVIDGEKERLRFEKNMQEKAPIQLQTAIPRRVETNAFYTYTATPTQNNDANEPLRYYWDMGDGIKLAGKSIQHQYLYPGEYTISLRVERGLSTNACDRLEKQWKVVVVE